MSRVQCFQLKAHRINEGVNIPLVERFAIAELHLFAGVILCRFCHLTLLKTDD